MARANTARRHGDDFQARWFWLKAASLLDPASPVTKVSYECGPKSFDDISVEYDPDRAPTDQHGHRVPRKHWQCKWHATAGVFGHDDLINPAFINATSRSFLERVHAAQSAHAPDGVGCRFELLTNWRVRADDPLLRIIRKEQNAIDLRVLFDGTGHTSRMGKVRKLWCDHLGLDYAGLELVARTMAISETSESLQDLRERLDDKLATVGMKRIPPGGAGHDYDDLIVKLAAQGRLTYDRQAFRQMCDREGLLDPAGRPARALALGVRSFMHQFDNVEERCVEIVDFVPLFDGRYIKDEAQWQGHILPTLKARVAAAARGADNLRLVLDAHVSIAFAVGAILTMKSGKRLEIEQRTGNRRYWTFDDQPASPEWPRLGVTQEEVGPGNDIALAIGLTRDVTAAVQKFASGGTAPIGRILHCRLDSGSSQQSVLCGRHASMLAEAIVQHVRDLAQAGGPRRIHLFISAPNGFAFFLGQHQQALGPATLYEFDFEGKRGGAYSAGITFQ
jgi:hypothetical protein